MKLSTLLVSSVVFNFTWALTSTDYEAIRSAFFWEIKRNFKSIDVATVMRLSFHDCAGGCDGCINVDNADNAGLDLAVDIVENVYQDVSADGIVVSRADVWAIAGRAAAEWGMEGMPGHEGYTGEGNDDFETAITSFVSPFPAFKYGREDCATAPYTTEIDPYPGAQWNHDQVFDYFAEYFGFDENQTVVIMGAHTLGRCALANSGYHGPWVLQNGRTTFSNAYYSNMISSTGDYSNKVNFAGDATGDDARPMYRCRDSVTGQNCGSMLNVDFTLLYEFTVDDTTRFITCDPSGSAPTCDRATSYDLVQTYSEDNDLFISAFTEVYDLMTANGAGSLTVVV